MATITALAMAGGTTNATNQWAPVPTLYSNTIDFAEALVLKGSALAAADVIEAIRFRAGSVIQWCGVQTIVADNATTLTLDIGIDTDPDGYIDGYDQGAAAAGDYAPTMLYDTSEVQVNVTANSIDVTLATLTGTLSTGKIRVFALITDVNGVREPGLAQVGA